MWGFGSLNDILLLIRHRDRKLIDRFCNLIKITGEPFMITTNKDKIQWAVTININSLFVQRIIDFGYTNIVNVEERPMPQGEFDIGVFLRAYAQLHYTYDTTKCSDGPWIRHRLRFYGSTELLEGLNRYLNQEFGVTKKKIQNHKVTTKMKMLYIQNNKEVPKILEWLQ